MKIIKEGDPVYKTRRFYCDECGCIFDVDKDEYEIIYYSGLEKSLLVNALIAILLAIALKEFRMRSKML